VAYFFSSLIYFLQRDFLEYTPPLDISQHITVSYDNLSPLTEISDGDDAFHTDNVHYLQEVVINTNFDPYLEENRKFPCGRSEEERAEFTKKGRQCVREHVVTPSTVEELTSLVF
jgi:hypothetical protein